MAVPLNTSFNRKLYTELLTAKMSQGPPSLLTNSSAGLSSRPAPAPLESTKYPMVNLWREDTYNKLLEQERMDGVVHEGEGLKGKVAISSGFNISCRYIEQSNGSVVNGYYLDRLFEKCHELFWQVEGAGLVPTSWKKMRADVVVFIVTELELDFPELQLCELHWKARRLAHYKFGSWYNDNKKKFLPTAIKQEPSTAPTGPDLTPVKRSRSPIDDDWAPNRGAKKVSTALSSCLDTQ